MIKSETSGRVARVRFDRVDKKNAITAQMYQQLGAALAAAEADPKVRAVLLHGTADCFTAGNDVADFLKRAVIPAEAGTGASPARAPCVSPLATGGGVAYWDLTAPAVAFSCPAIDGAWSAAGAGAAASSRASAACLVSFEARF